MDHNSPLTEQLRNLTRDTATDLEEVGASIHALTTQLAEAIPSFLGMTVTVTSATGDLAMTAVGPAAQQTPTTSLRFSLLHPAGRQTRMVLYAHQPGALVDLGANLTYLGRQPPSGGRIQTATDVCLDQDLILQALVPGVAGLEDRTAAGRAEGVLIDRGADPDHAASHLRRQAAAANLDLHQYARQLLAARAADTQQTD